MLPGYRVSSNHYTMSTKFLIAVVVAAILSFFGGWLIWGILLEGYMQSNMTEAAMAVQKSEAEMSMGFMILANAIWGFLMVWVVDRTASHSLSKGAVTGFILSLLITLGMDFFFYATMNMYSGLGVVAVDVLASGVLGAIIGGAAGWFLGRGQS